MDERIKDKRQAITIRKEKKRRRAIIIFIILSILTITLYYITIPFEKFPFYLFLTIGFVASIMMIYNPLDKEDCAFIEIVKALEIMENQYASDENRKNAYDNIIRASKYLDDIDSIKDTHTSWYRDIIKIENEFISNLKNYVAPSILSNKIDNSLLTRIAYAFISQSTEHIKITNELIEKNLEEVPFEDKSHFSSIYEYVSIELWDKIVFRILLAGVTSFLFVYLSGIALGEHPIDFFKKFFGHYLAFFAAMLVLLISPKLRK